MNCQEIENIVHAYLDGEVDLLRSLAIEQHLKACPACTGMCGEWRSLRTAIAGESLYFDAPQGLEQGVRSALGEPKAGAGQSSRTAGVRQFLAASAPTWNWRGLLLPFGAVALVLLLLLPLTLRHSVDNRLVEELTAAHVRSLMLDHKTDVASSDQHTVKPWFDGKLDYAPPVVDLAASGFPLVGGRLDYVQSRSIAALVYQRRQHFINLFIWPASDNSPPKEKPFVQRGYNLIRWEESGMDFWAVSDLNLGELADFARLLRQRQNP
jgi:anti-sigma factor RsiW